MDIFEYAKKINFSEYREEVSKELVERAKVDGVVIVFGASDDLIEFRGAIHDEAGCYEGGVIRLTRDGILENKCDDVDCPYFERLLKECPNTIHALWDTGGYSWVIQTVIPHAQFDIMEDGEKYCGGIVFRLEDLE